MASKEVEDQQRIYHALDPQPDELLQRKKLIREGEVSLVERKPSPRYLILFHDTLLLCEPPRKGKIKLKILVRLYDKKPEDMQIVEDPDSDVHFSIVTPKKSFKFQAADAGERQSWYSDLSSALARKFSLEDEEWKPLEGPYDPFIMQTEQQQQVFTQLREKLAKREPALTDVETAWCDDACLCRFLRARDYDLQKAYDMLNNTLKWRSSYRPNDIKVEDIDSEVASRKIYISNGKDLHGRPIVYMRPGRDTQESPENKVRFVVWMLEHANSIMNTQETGVEKWTWIVDFANSNVGSPDGDSIKVAKETLGIVQDHYPERLGQAFFLNPPLLFWTLFKVLSPFVDPVTKLKIQFLKNSKEYKKLLLYMRPDQLEEEYGGSLKVDYNHEEWRRSVGSDLAEPTTSTSTTTTTTTEEGKEKVKRTKSKKTKRSKSKKDGETDTETTEDNGDGGDSVPPSSE